MFTVTIQGIFTKHLSMVALEIRLHSIRIMAAIIWNYLNTRHNIITYSLMNYKCPNH